jgi:2-polyprenyl-3-methyl-5-hydroxy-6-metoxy-1,4-benzoquinol methylase
VTQPDADRIAEGEYARKQLSGRAGLIGWSHERRFLAARRMVAPFAGRRLLDYGCGDGTFLAQVHDLCPAATGVEVDDVLVRDARARFAAVRGLDFVHTAELDSLPAGAFGVVTCMEVLEHCTPESVDGVVAQIRRLAARDAAIIVSVPVETGPALLVKQAARAAAGARGISGYQDREHYRPGELARMLVAGRGTAIDRPVYETAFADGSPNRYHGHKGFNWRALAARLERDFVLERTRFSPLPLLGPLLNSQAWMLCRPR